MQTMQVFLSNWEKIQLKKDYLLVNEVPDNCSA